MSFQKFRTVRLCVAAVFCAAHFFTMTFCANRPWELSFLDSAGYALLCVVAHMGVRRILPQGLFSARPVCNAIADTLIFCAVCAALFLVLLGLCVQLIILLCLLGYGPAPS